MDGHRRRLAAEFARQERMETALCRCICETIDIRASCFPALDCFLGSQASPVHWAFLSLRIRLSHSHCMVWRFSFLELEASTWKDLSRNMVMGNREFGSLGVWALDGSRSHAPAKRTEIIAQMSIYICIYKQLTPSKNKRNEL